LLAPALLATTALLGVRSTDFDDTSLEVPDGLEVTLFAESPQLYNPTAIDVDERGRVWVAEAVNYRRWSGRNPGFELPGGDRVVVLEDTDGDGRADTSEVFVQDPELVSPLGIAVIGERVFVACSPTLWVYEDRDGDGKADHREEFLTGFGGRDHDHGLHSPVLGPDGRLYLTAGNAGPHVVTDRSGWTLRSGSLYTGGGSKPADNKPGLVSDDGRVWTGGLVISVQPDGTDLRVHAHNFRNNYEVCVDAFGNLFVSDNDDDGNEACRFTWVMDGGDYGYFSSDGARFWWGDRRPGQDTRTAHWRQDDPGVMPAGTITGSGGPTGVAVYEGRLLAPWIDGHVLAADAGRGAVYSFATRTAGAGIELEPGVLIQASAASDDERARWFRPSDVAVATDGSVLVADWYDPGVGGHAMGDREAYGRILRIAPEGAGYAPPAIDDPLAALESPAPNVRWRAWDSPRETLRALDEERPRDLRTWARELGFRVARGDTAQARAALAPELDTRIRDAALRALRRAGTPAKELFEWTRGDRDRPLPLARELALSVAGLSFEEQREFIGEFLSRTIPLVVTGHGQDRWMLEALGLAAHGHEDEWFALPKAAPDGRLDFAGEAAVHWTREEAALWWRLHPELAMTSFRARASAPSLDPEDRRQAVDALAFMPHREAADAVFNLSLAGPEDIRPLATWWSENRSTNAWREYGLLDERETARLEDADKVWSSDVVTRGLIDVYAPLNGARILWLVVSDGANGNACDWADWIEPALEGPAGRLELNRTEWILAEAQWGDVNVDANAVGHPMRIQGVAYPKGIGTHADSRIAFAIPDGYERFVSRAGVDDGGTRQPGAPTSVRFEVYTTPAPDSERIAAWTRELEDPDRSKSAALELAAHPEGAHVILERAKRGALPEEHRKAIAEALFANADFAVRALASEHFDLPWKGGEALPSISELAALEGDPKAGRELFFSERTQCATCHSITREGYTRGGHIGPELSSIASKFARPEIFDAILNPSASIAFGYETWMFVTEDGPIYSGFLLADGEDVILKDTRGIRHVIPADEIRLRHQQTLSTMPGNAALGLEAQELADLVSFLEESDGSSERFGEWERLFDGESLQGWTYYSEDRTAPAASVWTAQAGELHCAGSPIGYLRTERTFTNFELELEWRFDPALGAGNSGVLLRLIEEDKVWPRSIEAQLHSGNAGDIWNIGEFPMQTAAERTDGRRTQRSQPSSEKPLGEWNQYAIRLIGGRLELRINGVLQNTAGWCREVPGHIALQSEGAPIQFRNLRLRELRR